MEDHRLAPEQITAFGQYLHTEERSPGTVEKHLRDVRGFAAWLNGKPVTREVAAEWKEHRLSQHYAPSTINSMLAALNSLFRFLGWREHRVRFFKSSVNCFETLPANRPEAITTR